MLKTSMLNSVGDVGSVRTWVVCGSRVKFLAWLAWVAWAHKILVQVKHNYPVSKFRGGWCGSIKLWCQNYGIGDLGQ